VIRRAIKLTDCKDGATLASVWSWTRADEFAVAAEFTGGGTTVRWEFDRQIVIDGLREMAGLGDVKMRPDGQKSVRLVLSNDDGHIELDCPRPDIEAFVKDVLSRIPEPRLPSDADIAAVIEAWAR
jgi:hypothetical protein